MLHSSVLSNNGFASQRLSGRIKHALRGVRRKNRIRAWQSLPYLRQTNGNSWLYVYNYYDDWGRSPSC